MKFIHNLIMILLVSTYSTAALAVDTLYDNRFKQWLAKAQTGDTFSQYSLGNAYLRGNEVSIDRGKAVHWFSKAAEQGHAKSQYKLGYLYYSGKGVKRSYDEAIKWFQLAANSDYSPAQYYLGKMYASGQGTKQDYTAALDWLNRSMKNDYSPAASEIRRIERKLEQDRVKKKRRAAANKIVVAKASKPRPKKARKKKTNKKISVAELLLQGNWTFNNEPTEILPSAVNECSANASELYCKTDEIHITTEYADINYKMESIAGRFNDDKQTFTMKNKKKTLFVMPSDPDDPDVDPDNIPATGTVTQQMRCKFESNNKIRCFTDEFKKVYFTRN